MNEIVIYYFYLRYDTKTKRVRTVVKSSDDEQINISLCKWIFHRIIRKLNIPRRSFKSIYFNDNIEAIEKL